MKLYNKTKCPDAILRSILVAAGRSVGARTARVACKVTQGRSLISKGSAYSCVMSFFSVSGVLYTWHLKRVKTNDAKHRIIDTWHLKRVKTNDAKHRIIDTDGGWIEITLPRLHSIKRMQRFFPATDAITLAYSFLDTAQHEWAHIKDFQRGTYRRTPTTPSGRRIRWADRPCEIYAMDQVEQAKTVADDGIMQLALWLEETQPSS